jgi:tetratricopeptide (TPR) repeat protein
VTGPHPVRQPERFIMPYRAAVASRPDDAGAHFELGLMAWYVGRLLYIGPRGLSARRPWWREAVRALERAIALDPDLARALALLGLIRREMGSPATARPLLERAVRLRPDDRAYAGQLLAVLADLRRATDLTRWTRRVARRQGVSLGAVCRELRKARFPADPYTVVLNAFPGYRRDLDSTALDEVDAVRLRRERWSADAGELAQAERARRAIRIDRRRVPAPLRPLVPLARRWGVGDDAHRDTLQRAATAVEWRAVRRALSTRVGRAIHAWIDTYEAGRMAPEAAAFMYLLLAGEEMAGPRRTPARRRLS